MSLNAEPTAPEEREAQHFPPKSYAEVAEGPADSIASKEPTRSSSGAPEGPDQLPSTSLNRSSVTQQIDDNGAYRKSYVEVLEAPPQPQDAPTTHINGFNGAPAVAGRLNGTSPSGRPAKPAPAPIEPEKEQYEGSGQDNSPKSPTKKGHKRQLSLRANGSTPSSRSQHQIYHEHKDGNGGILASVKTFEDYENQLQLDKRQKPRKKNELVHGRQAGAGWTASKYASPGRQHHDCTQFSTTSVGAEIKRFKWIQQD